MAAATLALLAVDSTFTWSAIPYPIEAIALTAVPFVMAIRVVRGFPRSLEMAAATFAALLAVASLALGKVGFQADQTSSAIVVAIVLSATGLLSVGMAKLRNRLGSEPVIAIPRWPAAPVALRSPNRYRTHRNYR